MPWYLKDTVISIHSTSTLKSNLSISISSVQACTVENRFCFKEIPAAKGYRLSYCGLRVPFRGMSRSLPLPSLEQSCTRSPES